MLSKRIGLTARERKILAVMFCFILLAAGLSVFITYQYASAQSLSLTQNTLTGGTIAGAPTYTVYLDSGTYYAKNQWGANSVYSTNCSYVLQTVITAIYNLGGSVYFPSAKYTFTHKIIFPRGSHSLLFFGDAHSEQAHTLSAMPISGTIFASQVINDDLFSNTNTYNTWDAVSIQFRDITFIGPNSNDDLGVGAKGVATLNRGLHFTNLDGLTVDHCSFFGFGIAILGDFNGVDAAPMPGMGDIHDNLFSEMGLTSIRFNRFMQSKIHSNEFEAWGDFVDHIQLIDTNTINVNDNRFSVPVDRVPSMTEVILINTTSNLYCNQILINDNIVAMGNASGTKYPFIRMDDTTSGPVYPATGITSKGNLLQFDYTLATTDTPYIIKDDMVYGSLVADDYMSTLSDKGGNLRDLNSTFAANSFHQNTLTPLELNLQVGTLGFQDAVAIYMGKNSTVGNYAQVQYFKNANSNVTTWSTSFNVPSLWWFEVVINGTATQTGLYGVYQ